MHKLRFVQVHELHAKRCNLKCLFKGTFELLENENFSLKIDDAP